MSRIGLLHGGHFARFFPDALAAQTHTQPRGGSVKRPPLREDHRVIACALCGGTATSHLYTKFELGIERCDACGLVYANPRGAESIILARYSSEYFWNGFLPAVGAPKGRVDLRFLDYRYKTMLDSIRRYSPDGRRLIDVGCGAGLFLKAAERAGWEVGGWNCQAMARRSRATGSGSTCAQSPRKR